MLIIEINPRVIISYPTLIIINPIIINNYYN